MCPLGGRDTFRLFRAVRGQTLDRRPNTRHRRLAAGELLHRLQVVERGHAGEASMRRLALSTKIFSFRPVLPYAFSLSLVPLGSMQVPLSITQE